MPGIKKGVNIMDTRGIDSYSTEMKEFTLKCKKCFFFFFSTSLWNIKESRKGKIYFHVFSYQY